MWPSVTTCLLGLILVICQLGCYSTIPATVIDPIGANCRLVRETNWDNDYTSYTSGKDPERIMVGRKLIDMYLKSQSEYRYDLAGRLIYEKNTYKDFQYRANYAEATYIYRNEKLTVNRIHTDESGTVLSTDSYTLLLNNKGYSITHTYDAEDRRLTAATVFGAQKWVEGNLVLEWIDDDGKAVKITNAYDPNRLSIVNPRQFLGLGSKNLLLSTSHSAFACCGPGRFEYSYEFDSQGRVKRRIGLAWDTEFPDGKLPRATYLTEYQYACD